MQITGARPNVEDCASSEEFYRWYYLKSELVEFAKIHGLASNGGKSDVGVRIAAFLDSAPPPSPARHKPSSRFDWANADLSLETSITDNVSFGPNVRGFFKQQIGRAFVCNSDFMDWVREHAGSSLSDAVEAWRMLEARKADPAFQTRIRSHNQYNQFTRDILAANPGLSLASVRAIWRAKRARPYPMTYSADDLDLI